MKNFLVRLLILTPLALCLCLSACGTVESAAKEDCTSIGWQVGTPGYDRCFKDRVNERNIDYSNPPGDQPRPSLL
ncbi:hypothetical protein G7Z35_05315 [Polynucleobacter paneuropaeus]|uniref:hypothetical protein n=1 Tax=Polynucleobacter paneuropaeus TaxID=2527775 RepID=UPI0011B943E0|nr:hypothetical protein [Polynucleobacter paneuropaeus]MBT8623013.1 hypothetical protein [Polynucleobacter paneuropaeus]QWD03211.1 hypothetical protein G6723_05645 [Polynucleobacter paneuropaeus]QWD50346.1 hypothetical protein G7Z35_05315 [Polynucleobacter paneuropaeus]